jgi:hypothetical protein
MKYNQLDPPFLALTETWSLRITFNKPNKEDAPCTENEAFLAPVTVEPSHLKHCQDNWYFLQQFIASRASFITMSIQTFKLFSAVIKIVNYALYRYRCTFKAKIISTKNQHCKTTCVTVIK